MLWQGVGFAITVGTVFAIWAILAVSLNLVVGFTGLLSVGHIGFFGIGAYAMAILSSNPEYEQLRTEAIPTFAWPFFAALPVSVLLAGLVAIVVGVVFNRFRDDIYVLVSFGFAIIAFNVFLNWRGLTRGAFGIHEIARPKIGNWVLDGELDFLIFALVLLAIVMVIAWFIVTSSFGRVLTAIREDEQAIEVFGYQVTAVQARHMGHIRHDGGTRGWPVQQLDQLHRPVLVRTARIDTAHINRDSRRTGHDLGLSARRGWRSSCSKRGCASCRSCPSSTSARPDRWCLVYSWCC